MESNILFNFLLRLGDDSLILGQRLSELCGHGPILEEDIAMTNISLDLIGQATNLYNYASTLDIEKRDADGLAFLRFEHQYYNTILVEQLNGNFADTMVRQFFFDTYRKLLFEKLIQSTDPQLAAIAEKSLKETRYHLKHSSEWVIRLGDGTDLSQQKTQAAINTLWRYTDELFFIDTVENQLIQNKTIPDISTLKTDWIKYVAYVLNEGNLKMPEDKNYFGSGRLGKHSENMGYILAQLQYMQRAYPNMQW